MILCKVSGCLTAFYMDDLSGEKAWCLLDVFNDSSSGVFVPFLEPILSSKYKIMTILFFCAIIKI